MKQAPSVTKLLQKVDIIFDEIKYLKDWCKKKQDDAFTVTFYYDKDLNRVGVSWSDAINTFVHHMYEYTYGISSKGIHFISYAVCSDNVWDMWINWYHINGSGDISLLAVPNKPPLNSKHKTMYLDHQAFIKETLANLPAWATCCISD